MKKTFIILTVSIIALTSCGNKKKMEGQYNATFKMNQNQSKDSAAVNMTNSLLSTAQINMNFKTDGSVDYGVKMGDLANQQSYTYEIIGDSLIMKKDTVEEHYLIEHKDNGLINLSSKDVTLILTKAE